MIKGKDKHPSETISKLKNLLSKYGFNFQVISNSYSDNLYYIDIVDNPTGWGATGKGSSELLALASAYGELIERLQNLCFNVPINIDRSKYIDSELCSKDDLQNFVNLKYFNVPFDSDNEKIYKLPFYSVKEKKEVLLPIDWIIKEQGSNGMSSGNTPEEALTQGLSEILERFSEEMICKQKLSPPEIPRDYIEKKYPKQFEMLLKIENISNCHLHLFDASLGMNIPVLCLIIIDEEKQMYKESFGSHPLFEIALERCLTECVQKSFFFNNYQKASNMVEMNLYNSSLYNTDMMISLRMNSHNGSLPISFFSKKSSWEFKEWETNSSFSNKDFLNFLVSKTLQFSNDIFIRDCNYLGHPTYYIYIPNVSKLDIPPHIKEESKSYYITKILNNELNKDSRLKFIKAIQNGTLSDLNSWPNWENLYAVLAAAYLDDANLDSALDAISKAPSYDAFYKSVKFELELRKEKISEDCRDNIILMFYGNKYLNYIKNFWRSDNTLYNLFKNSDNPRLEKYVNVLKTSVIEQPLPPYNRKFSEEEKIKNRENMKRFLEKVISQKRINQSDLIEIFE